MVYRRHGKFIVIEGNEGAGKTIQAELLSKRLREQCPDREVISTSEPWKSEQSPVGNRIRRILGRQVQEIDPGDGEIKPVKFQTMYIADRYIHWVKLILPEVENGSIVISDRERLTTYAFGLASGIPLETMVNWHRLLPLPDLIIYIRVSTKTSLKRLEARPDKVEIHDNDKFVNKAHKAYEYLVKNDVMANIVVVDGEGTIEEVHEKVWEAVRKLVEDSGVCKLTRLEDSFL
ncbi:TPA: dTMP kinase [candidate division CPR2 bacterium]|uniref:Thymidylate kinase n=1 Tax=candidate division CPR2 bacterium GW2011_GWC1_41_48 TaxID=1618344 RepID=A0A0G0W7G2_UNCC2|nr:MAG: putative thymidylate kinase [candidate division CPR2 bacterium GW2011_GWC2_39_35]KKR27931.1 MAG: putative thymidylate kinase [candidate division CPR2 bacterium GW2011_GWD2_39_7]KKS08905.1 MAG: putative thymidylate kinase [candidate division CPR2 bacterium GW2011_GWC1_41_48]OGB72048.1 MAG: dTMP kinase [candidate division CPR2 bacterium GWD2_39_7]HBG81722.1 dTMP kinase [candidate division CPR2 bacterium]